MEGEPIPFHFSGNLLGLNVRHNGKRTLYLSVVDGETADPYLPMKVGGAGDMLFHAALYADCCIVDGVLHLHLTGNGLEGGEVTFQLNWNEIPLFQKGTSLIDLGLDSDM